MELNANQVVLALALQLAEVTLERDATRAALREAQARLEEIDKP